MSRIWGTNKTAGHTVGSCHVWLCVVKRFYIGIFFLPWQASLDNYLEWRLEVHKIIFPSYPWIETKCLSMMVYLKILITWWHSHSNFPRFDQDSFLQAENASGIAVMFPDQPSPMGTIQSHLESINHEASWTWLVVDLTIWKKIMWHAFLISPVKGC